MEQDVKSMAESLFENVLTYAEQRKNLLVLDATERSSRALSQVVASMFIAVLSGSALLFASISGAWFIGLAIDNMPMGFLLVALFYTLLLLVVLAVNKSFIQANLINYFIKNLIYGTEDHKS